MYDTPKLQYFSEVIPAGETRPIYFYARMLTLLSNTASEKISVGIGELAPVPLRAGLQYELPEEGARFTYLLLHNPEAVDTTVEFILSDGKVTDNRLTISGTVFDNLLVAMVAIQAEQQGIATAGDYGRITVGVAAVSMAAANANRKGIDIHADPDNTDFIYLGYDNTVTTINWFAKLSPGQAWSRENYRGDIFAISGTAAQYAGFGEV